MSRIPNFAQVDFADAPPAAGSAGRAVAHARRHRGQARLWRRRSRRPRFPRHLSRHRALPARPLPDHVRRPSPGPSGNMPASPRPRIPTPSTGAISPPGRRASRSPSISPPIAATTAITRASPATSAWRAWRSTRSTTCARCSPASRSTRCRVSMTMNGAVLPVLALYIVAAEEQGVPPEKLAGHDPERHPQRIHGAQHLHLSARRPRCASSPTSSPTPRRTCRSSTRSRSPAITCRRPGATADLELAYTLADGVEYVRAGHRGRARRRPLRAAAVVLLGDRHELLHGGRQAARRAPAVGEADASRSTPKDARSLSLRTHCQTSGWSLAAQDVFNNVVAHLRSRRWRRRRATPSRCTPTRSTRRWRCRPISPPASPATPRSCCSRRAAPPASIDPWGGSFYVERLTYDLARARPGATSRRSRSSAAWPRRSRPASRSCASRRPPPSTQARIDSGAPGGDRRQQIPADTTKRRSTCSRSTIRAVRQLQIDKLKRLKRERDPQAVAEALDALTRDADGGNGNLLALAIDAARAKATVGEISSALEKVFGRHRAEIKAISGVYKREVGMTDAVERVREARRRIRGERRPPAAHPGRQDRPGRPRPRPEGDRLGLRRSRLRRRYRPAVRDAGGSRAPGGRERRAHPRRLLARRRASDAGAGAEGRAASATAATTS